MNSKKYLLEEAESLYVYDFVLINDLAKQLNLNRKTIMAWRDEYGWEQKRKTYLRSKQSFHEELFEFARKLMKDISANIGSGVEADSGKMSTLCRILPMLPKVKDYEDIIAQKDCVEERPKGLSPQLIAQIEEEVLGIRHDDDNTETE